MLDTSLLFKSLKSQVSKMTTELELVRELTEHSGEKGREIEGILGNVLKEMLSTNWEVSTGFVVNPQTNQSPAPKATGQTDIMIYNPQIAPPIFRGYMNDIIPIHSLACAIEVKTTLTSADQLLEECLEPAENLKTIYEEVKVENKKEGKKEGNPPYNILFCYESDITLQNIQDTLNARPKKPSGAYKAALDLVVVFDRGIVYRNSTNYYGVHACYVEGTTFKTTSKPLPEAKPWVFNEFYADLTNYLNEHAFPYYENKRWTMK